jgi:hypothetical protein
MGLYCLCVLQVRACLASTRAVPPKRHSRGAPEMASVSLVCACVAYAPGHVETVGEM